VGWGVDRCVNKGKSNTLNQTLLVMVDAPTTTSLLSGSSNDLGCVGLACLQPFHFFGGHKTSSMEIRSQLFVVQCLGEGVKPLLMRMTRGGNSFQDAIDTSSETGAKCVSAAERVGGD
jgi:hypothetical protein